MQCLNIWTSVGVVISIEQGRGGEGEERERERRGRKERVRKRGRGMCLFLSHCRSNRYMATCDNYLVKPYTLYSTTMGGFLGKLNKGQDGI